jgi:capsular polysaccharide biosynthesis protein
LAFFVEYMDDTVRTPEQAEGSLGAPVLGRIPSL